MSTILISLLAFLLIVGGAAVFIVMVVRSQEGPR